MTPLPISRASSFSLLLSLLFLFPFTSSPSPFLIFLPFSLLRFARFHVSRLVSSCPSFSFFCLLFLFSSLLSSLADRFARVPVYVRLPIHTCASRTPRAIEVKARPRMYLYVAGLSSRFSKNSRRHHNDRRRVEYFSNTQTTFFFFSPLLEYPRRASRLCTSLLPTERIQSSLY